MHHAIHPNSVRLQDVWKELACYTITILPPHAHTQSIEDTILKLLFESTGNILDDEKLIETLDASKVHHRCASDALNYHMSLIPLHSSPSLLLLPSSSITHSAPLPSSLLLPLPPPPSIIPSTPLPSTCHSLHRPPQHKYPSVWQRHSRQSSRSQLRGRSTARWPPGAQ